MEMFYKRVIHTIHIAIAIAITSFMSVYFTHTVFAVTTEVLYQSDFSTDPHWTTDQPDNFFWDASRNALFARVSNTPPSYSPNRYFYYKTSLNPKLSYELVADIQILSIQSPDLTNGISSFGVYGDGMRSFFTSILDTFNGGAVATFSTRLMTLDGKSRYIFNELSPDGTTINLRQATQQYPFSIGTWYTITQRYDALTHEYHYDIKERESGVSIFSNTITVDSTVHPSPLLKNIGIGTHPEGAYGTNLWNRVGVSEYLIDNVTLTQIYDETYTAPSSVLFLPGIQASRLYKDGLLGSEDRLWEPNNNNDVSQLAMTTDGQSVEDIYTRDTVDAIFGIYDVYGSFQRYLDAEKTRGIISDWKSFAYDWRHSVTEVVANGTQYKSEQRRLIETVEALAKNNNSPVTIIAHSNGGLLAKALVRALEAEGKAHLIDRIIFVATPQLGTPEAIGSVLHGYDQAKLGGWLVQAKTAREVIRNFEGVYGLVPSEKYLAESTDPVVSFDHASSTDVFTIAYGTSIDSSDELADFMIGTVDGRPVAHSVNEVSDANADMLRTAQNMHRATLDAWVAPPHVQVIEIVGVGLNTIKGFRYQEFLKQTCIPAGTTSSVVCAYDPYYEPVPMFTQYGDETVVAHSAEAYAGDKLTYYVDLDEVRTTNPEDIKKHADITGLGALQQFIGGLLQNTTVSVPFIYGIQPTFNNTREVIAVHSPVSLTLTDTLGNKVGKFSDGSNITVITTVPGSSYFEIGGATYIIVPSTTEYDVHITGKEEGSYTMTINTLVGEAPASLVSAFPHATTTSTMLAGFSKRLGVYGDIVIDYNGDGIIDEQKTIDGEPITADVFQTLRDEMSALVLLKQSERDWLIHAVTRAERTGERKGYGSDGVVRIFAQVDARLVQYRTDGLVTDVEYNTMKTLMTEIMSR